jgi:hypothetical protein
VPDNPYAQQLEALTNENRHHRIREQYLIAVLDAAEAELTASFGAGLPGQDYFRARRALNVACETARLKLRDIPV